MTRILAKFLVLMIGVASVSSFTSINRLLAVPTTTRCFMFSGDEEVKPLAEATDAEEESISADPLPTDSTVQPTSTMAQNFGRAGEIKEVKWVDPAMEANTDPFNISAWAYALVGFPMILLLNDFLHFIPESAKEGPLGFLL